MKRFVWVSILAFSLFVASTVFAHDLEKKGRFGLGPSMGWPGIGLTTNTFVATDMSVQADLYPFWSFGGFALDVDYLFWLHDITKQDAFHLTWFAGPGAVLMVFPGGKYYNGGAAGAFEGAVGLSMQFNDAPMDLNLQLSPGISFFSGGAGFWITSMISTRYYF